MLRKFFFIFFLLTFGAVSAWLYLGQRETTQQDSSGQDTIAVDHEQIQLDLAEVPVTDDHTRYETDFFSVDYPADWKLTTSHDESARRWVFKSADSTLSLYAVPKTAQIDLAAWIERTQTAYFDAFDFLADNIFSLRGQEAVVVQYCEDAISYTAYFESRDNFFVLWTSGSEADLRILLEHLYFGGADNEAARLPEQFALYDEPVCHPSTETEPEPDPDTVCDFSEAAENTCCNQFTEQDVPYWSCSANATDDYGNCTWWTAYKRPDVGAAAADHPGFGDACNWDYWAYLDGLLVDDCPREGDIFVYDVQGCPGHVASVEQVLWDEGKIEVSEMNWCLTCLQTREFVLANRKYIHEADPEIVIYPDLPNDIALQFTVVGSCNGKQNFHTDEAGIHDFSLDEAAAVLVPPGWSVALYAKETTERICLEQSGLLSDYVYPQSGQSAEDNVSAVEIFLQTGCPAE